MDWLKRGRKGLVGVALRLGRLLAIVGLGACLPAAAAVDPGLPPVEFVLQQIATNSVREPVNDAAFAAHYRFVRWKQQDELDAQRRVVKSNLKSSTNSPTGQAWTAESASGVDDEEPPGHTNTLQVTRGAQVKGRAVGKREMAIDDELLRHFTFTVTGREDYEGRSVLALDFAPNPQAPSPRNVKEKFIQHLAGRIWVDEQTWFVAKLEARLLESVSVVGGLVGSVKDLRYAFARSITPEGWWYTKGVDWELIGRAVISRKHIVYHEGRTNVARIR